MTKNAPEPASPYRPRPESPVSPEPPPSPPPRTLPRGAIAAVMLMVAGGAFLAARARQRKQPTIHDVPEVLLRTGDVFPAALADMPPSTPLAPLLAADQPEALTVIDPPEGARRVSRGTSLVVRFNRVMVSSGEVGRPLAQSPLRFSPRVRGTARWLTRSSLAFDADPSTWNAPLETTLTFDESLRSLGGESLDPDLSRTIVFAGGTQLDPYASTRRVLPGEPLKLYFRGPVDIAALTPMTMVYEIGGGQRTIPFTLSPGPRDDHERTVVNVNLARALDPGSRVAVALAPAVYPPWEGSDQPGVLTFEFAPTPRFEGIACPEEASEASSCEHQGAPGRIVDIEQTLRLWATNPIAQPLPADAVTVVPTVPQLRVSARNHTLEITAEWEPGQVYELRVGTLLDTGGHVLGTPGPLAIRSQGLDPDVQTATGRLTFEAIDRLDLPFAAVHVDRGEVWYAPVAEGQELRAALLLPEPSTLDAQNFTWSRQALQPMVPRARANRWGRGRYDWFGPERRSSVALLSFDPDGTEGGRSPTPPIFLQRTDLGIGVVAVERGMLVRVSSLRSAEPIADAAIEVADRDARPLATARTDALGMAFVPLPASSTGGRVAVRATKGDDRAVLVYDPTTAVNAAALGVATDGVTRNAELPVASVWTDRGAYRPGESLHAKAILRLIEGDTARSVRRGTVRIVVNGPDGVMASRSVTLSPYGSVDADFTFPPTAMLGEYTVNVTYLPPPRRGNVPSPPSPQSTSSTTINPRPTIQQNATAQPSPNATSPMTIGSTTVRVGEFRQPTVRVDLDVPNTPLGQGDTLRVGVRGEYLFGAPTANASARWSVLRDGAGEYPVRWERFTFSTADAAIHRGTMHEGTLTLDAQGRGEVTATVSLAQAQRERVTVEVAVRDASGQETSAWRSITVYPADFEVGVKNGPDWVEQGVPLDLEAIVIDHDNNPVQGRPVQARILREGWHTYWEWHDRNHRSDEREDASDTEGSWQARRNRNQEVVHTCALTSAYEPVRCTYTPTRAGTYVLEAMTTDARGRRSVASRRLYVAVPGQHPDRDPPGAPIQLTPERQHWFVGERMRLAFECPWPEGEAQVTVLREGILHTERRRVQSGGVVLELPVTREMIPNAYVVLSLVRPRTSEPRAVGMFDLGAPDLRWGVAAVDVRPQNAFLRVDMTLGTSTTRPGQDIPIDVVVRDSNNRPARAEVTLYAVDEGTLRLTHYAPPTPTQGLLLRRAPSFTLEDLRRSLVSRIDFPALPGTSGDGDEADGPRLRDDRELFDPTPLWMPRLVTDSEGRVRTTLHVPSRNTRYQVMAVAVDDGMRSGNAAAPLTVSRPVVLRPALPRALTEGDRAELAVFLHNTEAAGLDATITPIINGQRRSTRTVHIEPGAEVRVSEPVEASGDAVLARFEVQANGFNDHMESSIPVQPRARWSRAGAVGAVRDTRTLSLDLPDDVGEQGTVRLTVATHPFVAVDGAMEDLLDAPWGGTDAAASSVLGWTALTALDPGLRPARWSRHEIREMANRAVDTLASLVNPNSGGLGAWSSSEDLHPYLTVYAAHALLAAERAGFAVPTGLRDRVASAVSSELGFGYFSDGTFGTRDEEAYALRVLAMARRPNGARVTTLYELRDALSPFGLAQLALAMEPGDTRRDTLIALGLRRLGTVTHGQFRDATGLRWQASSARTVGAMLEALCTASNDTRGMRELAATLLQLRVGRAGASWGSPHETAHALIGLAAYARRFAEGRTLEATVLLDGNVLRPEVRTKQAARYLLPVRTLGASAHRLQVHAAGPAFYALDARWATPLGPAEQIARGRDVALHRVFETEAGTPIASGGHVRLGDLIRVRLFVYSEGNTAPFVVLRDPVGGGFEAVDQGFATSPQASLNALLGGGPDDGALDPRGFYAARSLDQISHRAFRRGVTTFYFNTGASGLREFTYALRATTVGTFTVPPASLEALYHPTQAARSTAITLVVDP